MSDSLTDVLAIAAHRDDVEQTCGGTLLKMAAQGGQTAILDLTRGESGTRGTADERAQEAAAAAKLLGVQWRKALDLPDGNVTVNWENKLKVAAVLRELRPRVVIVPYWQARHPDHAAAGVLGYEACFVAGLSKVETRDSIGNLLAPWRPFKIIYASLYADVRPSFVVDISEHIERRLEALLAYTSQYSNQQSCLREFVTPNRSYRKKSVWWTICGSFLCSLFSCH
jgi:N-acetylglucosamine malate deacetylase 1